MHFLEALNADLHWSIFKGLTQVTVLMWRLRNPRRIFLFLTNWCLHDTRVGDGGPNLYMTHKGAISMTGARFRMLRSVHVEPVSFAHACETICYKPTACILRKADTRPQHTVSWRLYPRPRGIKWNHIRSCLDPCRSHFNGWLKGASHSIGI